MRIITVNPSDTVFSISREYNLSPQKIIDDNGLDENASLAVGQSLALLFPEQTYIPSEDELLSSVAAKYGVSEKDLLRNNIFLGGRNYAPAGKEIVINYASSPPGEKIITGYAYDFISGSLLDTVISYMTFLIPFTYGFTPGGDLIYPDDENLIDAALNYSVKPLMHLSTLTANGVFSNELAH
ncbi:MAG: LysM peptidoglycan-binding domain-containing protein, partial [Clostridiales bacterium]|nr:LysM peptidoglycan-binding domain-containing protein [Clostridiales bacterium]